MCTLETELNGVHNFNMFYKYKRHKNVDCYQNILFKKYWYSFSTIKQIGLLTLKENKIFII